MDEKPVTDIEQSFVPVVRTDGDVSLREAGALAVVAAGDASLSDAGSGVLVVGGSVEMEDVVVGSMIVGGNVDLADAVVGGMLASDAALSDSRVGVLLAGRTNLESSEVVLTTQQVAVLGVAAGLTMFLLGRLFRRR